MCLSVSKNSKRGGLNEKRRKRKEERGKSVCIRKENERREITYRMPKKGNTGMKKRNKK